MSVRFHLRVSTRLYASLEDVWQVKTDVDHLEAELHPWLRATLDKSELQAGLRGEGLPRNLPVRFWGLGVVPLPTWPLQLVEYEHNRIFVDTTAENPLFHEWEHRHIVEQASDAVRYMDAITFSPRFGPPHLVARWIEFVFKHRHRRTARQFETDERATAVAFLRVVVETEDSGEGFL
ncbi:MAG TPA: hypothetical protein QGF58_21330 [Myxococcota bacterium]|nr:hypothetical protein [Myxococcota bacterium]